MYKFGFIAFFCLVFVSWTTVEAVKRRTTPTRPTIATTTENSAQDPARDVAEGSQSGADSTLTEMVGNNVKTKPYDPMYYEGNSGGPMKGGDDLECKSGQVCCWANTDKQSSTMKWQTGSGPADPEKFQSSFNTQKTPDENYLVAYSDSSRPSSDKALFESCSIVCAEGNIEVTFRYWATAGIVLQVCTKDAFFGDTEKLSNCRNVQTGNKQSGLAKVIVPGGQLIALDLVASSFSSDTGSVVIVDRINVSFKACPAGGQTQPKAPAATQAPQPVPPTTASSTSSDDDRATNCPALQCSFDQDMMCGYKEYRVVRANANMPTRGFAIRHGRFENLLTGVVEPKDGGGYTAAYLYTKDTASLRTDLLKISSPRILRFNGYIAAQGLRLKVCLDNDLNCPIITSSDVKVADRKKWKTYNVLLPKGTKQVFFIAENTDTNEGAVGIDNIDLLRPLAGAPVDAEQQDGTACGATRKRVRHR